jgi:eukaryotic-like serine/threonine-protein kinase
MIGTTVSHYSIRRSLGVGGMGLVYLADDTRLNRKVALKFLPPSVASDPHAKARFMREAQAASALDHPNVATIYEIGEWQDQLFIAMAYYDGETLKERLSRGRMTVAEVASVLLQIANGLSAAHRAGVVHRDLKPANILLVRDGQVKILDFGIAKFVSDDRGTATRLTEAGATVGTIAYMAPEQVEGREVDARADIWALGVIAYEMLAGRLPFGGSTVPATAMAILNDEPPDVGTLRPDVPEELRRIVGVALQKNAQKRTIDATTIASDVSAWHQASSSRMPAHAAADIEERRWWIAGATLVLAAALALAWFVRQTSNAKWARERAVPEVERLADQEQYVAAFRLANEAKRYIPSDPVWQRLDPVISRVVSLNTSPSGAAVYYRDYRSTERDWVRVGVTPVTNASVPNTFFAWRIEKPGFLPTLDAAGSIGGPISTMQSTYTLRRAGESPAGMMFVTGDRPARLAIPGLDHLPPVKVPDFWIDQYEVTNREFKRFVDADGYRNAALWRHAFVDDGRTLTFDQAMKLFTDASGRPGPATWELGAYPEGQEDFPVSGVSWFEADAYAAFVGKSLPTIYHWNRAADPRTGQFVVPRSNFSGHGPTKVGSSGGMNRFGVFDLAGNVKEWCWNRADTSKRYIMGGAWDEPSYIFNDADARSPFQRAPNFGFRCAKYVGDEPLARPAAELLAFEGRDFNKEKPVGDEEFAIFRRLYSYDKTELKPVTDSTDDSNADWRREKISYAAAYGGERIPAFLYLPKATKRPLEAVVVFPGSGALLQRSSNAINMRSFDWIIRTGRAVVYPIYKSTYERGDGLESDYPNMTAGFRDHVIAWVKDLSRTIDYLETRPDIAADRIAYLGLSWGAGMGPIFVTAEERFKAAIFWIGGPYVTHALPEVDAINFAPRMKTPVLELSGRFDFEAPVDTAQIPMFKLYGPPDTQKRRVMYDTGHNIPRPESIREGLDWLDRYLGPTDRSR